jgi:hypothetical protein
MRNVVIVFLHLMITVVRLARPGGLPSVVAGQTKIPHVVSRKRRSPPGPKGLHKELVDSVVELKRHNPRDCLRIAQQITSAFGVAIDKDVVHGILSVHYRPESDSADPSWLTFLGPE